MRVFLTSAIGFVGSAIVFSAYILAHFHASLDKTEQCSVLCGIWFRSSQFSPAA